MSSIILRSSTRYLLPLLMLFSVFLLLRGHDEPGGGFIGGLLAATAFALYALAYDVESSRRMLRIDEHLLLGIGLFFATSAGVIGIIAAEPFLTSQWGVLRIPGIAEIKLGTPLLFDLGVYLVVVGVTVMIIFALAEED